MDIEYGIYGVQNMEYRESQESLIWIWNMDMEYAYGIWIWNMECMEYRTWNIESPKRASYGISNIAHTKKALYKEYREPEI